ncbi:hypothetical protein SNEBB_007048 [Seison nebaliae]|nr:hypothetical protein SNEBB_007048 [Seison nebaliae]
MNNIINYSMLTNNSSLNNCKRINDEHTVLSRSIPSVSTRTTTTTSVGTKSSLLNEIWSNNSLVTSSKFDNDSINSHCQNMNNNYNYQNNNDLPPNLSSMMSTKASISKISMPIKINKFTIPEKLQMNLTDEMMTNSSYFFNSPIGNEYLSSSSSSSSSVTSSIAKLLKEEMKLVRRRTGKLDDRMIKLKENRQQLIQQLQLILIQQQQQQHKLKCQIPSRSIEQKNHHKHSNSLKNGNRDDNRKINYVQRCNSSSSTASYGKYGKKRKRLPIVQSSVFANKNSFGDKRNSLPHRKDNRKSIAVFSNNNNNINKNKNDIVAHHNQQHSSLSNLDKYFSYMSLKRKNYVSSDNVDYVTDPYHRSTSKDQELRNHSTNYTNHFNPTSDNRKKRNDEKSPQKKNSTKNVSFDSLNSKVNVRSQSLSSSPTSSTTSSTTSMFSSSSLLSDDELFSSSSASFISQQQKKELERKRKRLLKDSNLAKLDKYISPDLMTSSMYVPNGIMEYKNNFPDFTQSSMSYGNDNEWRLNLMNAADSLTSAMSELVAQLKNVPNERKSSDHSSFQ